MLHQECRGGWRAGRGSPGRAEHCPASSLPCLPGFRVVKFSCHLWKNFFQDVSIPVLSPSEVSYHFCLFLFKRGKKSWCQTLAGMGKAVAKMTVSPGAGSESAAFASQCVVKELFVSRGGGVLLGRGGGGAPGRGPPAGPVECSDLGCTLALCRPDGCWWSPDEPVSPGGLQGWGLEALLAGLAEEHTCHPTTQTEMHLAQRCKLARRPDEVSRPFWRTQAWTGGGDWLTAGR